MARDATGRARTDELISFIFMYTVGCRHLLSPGAHPFFLHFGWCFIVTTTWGNCISSPHSEMEIHPLFVM